MGVLFILYKKDVLHAMPLPFLAISHRKGRRTLRATLYSMSGAKVFNYFLKKDIPLHFVYDVTVVEGEIRLVVQTNEEIIFKETFTKDSQGRIEFVPKAKFHSIRLAGDFAKGKCACEFVEKN